MESKDTMILVTSLFICITIIILAIIIKQPVITDPTAQKIRALNSGPVLSAKDYKEMFYLITKDSLDEKIRP